ncbi:glycosyltransferase [Aureimonas leprariae]|uniref:Glycosyltransferase n=1 Tax=Plantimonas leprariae TaxID=2615207 RepID=A0A7V7PRN3_9HYPH|nr:glycosyltransferase [Aureimonas leprariae]KAB0681353.1 glycosyltransferase [Aureimonas leprariae]
MADNLDLSTGAAFDAQTLAGTAPAYEADAAAVDYDLVFVADPRLEGGTSTALAEEIAAASQVGLRLGLLMVRGSLLGRASRWMHPGLQALVDAGAVAIVDPALPARTRLAVVHHPTIFALPPRRMVRVAAGRTVLVLHHPRLDRAGAVQYDLAAVAETCGRAFGCDVEIAPVSTIVRRSLPATLPDGVSVLAEDWYNVFERSGWKQRGSDPPRYPVRIGRHARPDPRKWPDTREEALAVYSPDPEFCTVSILGGGAFLGELYGELPENWRILPFAFDGVDAFLAGLDFFVYFHGSAWSEAFGRVVVEAMAAGVPVILPAYLHDSFGDAALYCAPDGVQELVEQLVEQQSRYYLQVRRGHAFVARHSHRSFVERLGRLIDPRPAPTRARAVAGPRPAPRRGKSILFVSTNGIGLGHLTRQMAIADRLPDGVGAIFATMSYAMKIAADAGYPTHFISYHRHYGADPKRWNRALREELFDLIAFTRPEAIAYDGSYLFAGLLDAIAEFPATPSFWIRRPMWRDSHAVGLAGAETFDHVVEPGELADRFDAGPTKPLQQFAYLTAPVLHLDPAQRLGRDAARRALELPEDACVVALQLGSGRNFDMRPIRDGVIAFARRRKLIVLEFASPIRDEFAAREPAADNHRIVECFPTFLYSQAFDFAVAAAGYNTFHENVFGAVPTIFVPNEAAEMDIQLNRARFADIFGYGCLLRRDHERSGLTELLDRMLDPSERAEIARRCRRLSYRNGAADIARLMAQSTCYLRTDLPFVQAAAG